MGVLVGSRFFVWEEELLRRLLDRLASVNLSLEEDRWAWRLDGSGSFSVYIGLFVAC
jgi:hypothetical protein